MPLHNRYLHAFTKTWLLKTLTSQSSPIRVALRDGAVAETVRDLREDSKIHLTLVSKVIKDRVNANEQPYGSDSIEKPEMADVRALGGIWFSVGTQDRWMSGWAQGQRQETQLLPDHRDGCSIDLL